MISVVVPAFNDGEGLLLALASLICQSLTDWECIVVDDGSDQPVTDVVRRLGDPRIRVVTHQRNYGRGAARASGLAEATGEFIVWQDADDFSHPRRFESQLECFEHDSEVAFVGTGLYATDGVRCLGVLSSEQEEARYLRDLEDPPVAHASLMFRQEVLDDLSYRVDLRVGEDYEFLSRALRRHSFKNLGRPLYAYRYGERVSLLHYWASQRVRARVMLEGRARRPTAYARAIGCMLRAGIYAIAAPINLSGALALRSYTVPTPAEHEDFAAMLGVVRGALA